MKRFPAEVRAQMDTSGASVTCVPVRLDGGDWESAVFFQIGGSQSKEDRRILRRSTKPVPLEIETDIIEHESATVIMLRFEALTVPEDPLAGEVLLTPGASPRQFEVLKLLTRQNRLCWFFSDASYWVLHAQQHDLGKAHHDTFDELLRQAVQKDAVIRMTAGYDAGAALSFVASHYELRT